MLRALRMLSGVVAAIRRRSGGWGRVTDEGIDNAVRALLEGRFGWHVEYGGSSGWLYYKRNGDPAFESATSFHPVRRWDEAVKAAMECADGGAKVRFEFRRGARPRHLCAALLEASGVAPGSPKRLNEISSRPVQFCGYGQARRSLLVELGGVLKGL